MNEAQRKVCQRAEQELRDLANANGMTADGGYQVSVSYDVGNKRYRLHITNGPNRMSYDGPADNVVDVRAWFRTYGASIITTVRPIFRDDAIDAGGEDKSETQ